MALRTLRNPRYVPPGGAWFYRIEPQGINIESRQSLDDVESQVARFYRANNIPVPENLRALIEDHMCQHLPSGNCSGPDGRPQRIDAPGYFDTDAFYEGTGRYTLWLTSNEWIRRVLAGAGVRTAAWAPFDVALFWHLR